MVRSRARTSPRAVQFGIAVTLLLGTVEAQVRWNQFRGAGSRGIAAADQPLPTEFGPTKNLLWKSEVDPGHSSPCIWGDRIFLTSHVGKKLATICIDRTTGKVVWRREVEAESVERMHRINNSASSTPATDGERVYAYFGSFGLV